MAVRGSLHHPPRPEYPAPMSLTLHGFPFSTYTRSVRLFLAEKGLDYRIVPARMRSSEYTALHPWRKMPVLEHDGFRVFEAFAIGRYLDEAFEGPALQPADPRARAQMTQWASAISDYLVPHAVRGVLIPRLVLPARGIVPDDPAIHVAAGQSRAALEVFEQALTAAPYLAGETPSLADWLLLPIVDTGRGLEGADRYTDGLPAIDRWLERLVARPSYEATLPG